MTPGVLSDGLDAIRGAGRALDGFAALIEGASLESVADTTVVDGGGAGAVATAAELRPCAPTPALHPTMAGTSTPVNMMCSTRFFRRTFAHPPIP